VTDLFASSLRPEINSIHGDFLRNQFAEVVSRIDQLLARSGELTQPEVAFLVHERSLCHTGVGDFRRAAGDYSLLKTLGPYFDEIQAQWDDKFQTLHLGSRYRCEEILGITDQLRSEGDDEARLADLLLQRSMIYLTRHDPGDWDRSKGDFESAISTGRAVPDQVARLFLERARIHWIRQVERRHFDPSLCLDELQDEIESALKMPDIDGDTKGFALAALADAKTKRYLLRESDSGEAIREAMRDVEEALGTVSDLTQKAPIYIQRGITRALLRCEEGGCEDSPSGIPQDIAGYRIRSSEGFYSGIGGASFLDEEIEDYSLALECAGADSLSGCFAQVNRGFAEVDRFTSEGMSRALVDLSAALASSLLPRTCAEYVQMGIEFAQAYIGKQHRTTLDKAGPNN